MTCVWELQEIECFTPAYLTEDDPVGTVAEGCFQEIADAHSRQAVLWLPGFEANEVVLAHLNFRGVFDEENSLILGNEFSKNIQKSCLARPSALPPTFSKELPATRCRSPRRRTGSIT